MSSVVDINSRYPDSKVHGANMRPIWSQQGPGGPHVDPMDFAIWVYHADELSKIPYDIVSISYRTDELLNHPYETMCHDFSIRVSFTCKRPEFRIEILTCSALPTF